jgi:hypothetical protein
VAWWLAAGVELTVEMELVAVELLFAEKEALWCWGLLEM